MNYLTYESWAYHLFSFWIDILHGCYNLDFDIRLYKRIFINIHQKLNFWVFFYNIILILKKKKKLYFVIWLLHNLQGMYFLQHAIPHHPPPPPWRSIKIELIKIIQVWTRWPIILLCKWQYYITTQMIKFNSKHLSHPWL